jgi:hypothetical protein
MHRVNQSSHIAPSARYCRPFSLFARLKTLHFPNIYFRASLGMPACGMHSRCMQEAVDQGVQLALCNPLHIHLCIIRPCNKLYLLHTHHNNILLSPCMHDWCYLSSSDIFLSSWIGLPWSFRIVLDRLTGGSTWTWREQTAWRRRRRCISVDTAYTHPAAAKNLPHCQFKRSEIELCK